MTMTPNPGFPRSLPPDATAEETGAYLGDLLDWLTKRKRQDLRGAGFTDTDLFALRKIAHAYRTNTLTPDLMALSTILIGKMESLRV